MNENTWISTIFDAREAKRGGIVRRAVKSVQKFASEEMLVWAVKQRGYHLIRTEKQFVIFCNSGLLKMII